MSTKNSQKTILIVEDEKDIRESLQDCLEYSGYNVVSASNGQDALSKLETMSKPDLVLLDLMMPVMNGWEFADAISKMERFKHLPIVVVSAFSDRSKNIQCLGILPKPYDLTTLLSTIETHINNPIACSP